MDDKERAELRQTMKDSLRRELGNVMQLAKEFITQPDGSPADDAAIARVFLDLAPRFFDEVYDRQAPAYGWDQEPELKVLFRQVFEEVLGEFERRNLN